MYFGVILFGRREKPVQLCVYHIGDLLEVLGAVAELDVVGVHDQEVSLVVLDPVLVLLVQAGQVLDAYALLVVAAALLDLGDERGDGALEV